MTLRVPTGGTGSKVQKKKQRERISRLQSRNGKQEEDEAGRKGSEREGDGRKEGVLGMCKERKESNEK